MSASGCWCCSLPRCYCLPLLLASLPIAAFVAMQLLHTFCPFFSSLVLNCHIKAPRCAANKKAAPAWSLQTRKMRLSEFHAAYPGDFQAGALEEIRERCAAMAAAAAAAPVPATGRGTRTAAKRAVEPDTVLRTVRARRGPVAPPPKFSETAPAVPADAADTATRRGTRSRLAGSVAAEQQQRQEAEQQQGKCSVWPGCAQAATLAAMMLVLAGLLSQGNH